MSVGCIEQFVESSNVESDIFDASTQRKIVKSQAMSEVPGDGKLPSALTYHLQHWSYVC